MRLVVKSLLIISLILPSLMPIGVGAKGNPDPCAMALSPGDLPVELAPEANAQASLDVSDDPMVCERVFRAEPIGPSGVSEVRSLVLLSPSVKQAKADYAEYRILLLENGWQEVEPQPVGDEGTVFLGTDWEAGIFSVQQLFHRGYAVALIEATGPLLETQPEVILDLARVVDTRVAQDLGSTLANPLRGGSIWPAVAVPTMVGDARVAIAPPVGLGMQLGGFSGLVSLDPEGTKFVTITDRGPNLEQGVGKSRLEIMPVPAFTPSIAKLELQNGQLRVTERIGLRLPAGFNDPRTGSPYITGLPNRDSDPAAFDVGGHSRWGLDPYGVDTEGIALDPRDGSYWICEEYGPSILHVATDGTILTRLMPSGAGVDAPGQNVRTILPGELAHRKPNRGFEGVAVSPDGSRLFAIMQSPISDPDRTADEASRNIRLVSLDLTNGEPRLDGMYVYLAEPAARVGALQQDDVKVGDLAALSPTRLLVAERDSNNGGAFKMVYRVDLDGATNILGRLDFGGRTMEQNNEDSLYGLGVSPVAKSAIVNVANLGFRLEKFEGLAVVDESTLAVVDDNDFGVLGVDSAGRLQPNGVPSRLMIVHLPGSLMK